MYQQTASLASSKDFIKNSEIKPNYSILLMHEPSLIEDIDKNRYQLVLAGHTHLGQINIPLINNLLAPKKDNKYIK